MFCYKTFGHFGYKKVFQRIEEKFHWPGMRRDIKDWANSSKKCIAKNKPSQKFSHPFGVVALDIMGPIPESEGFKCILLTEDQFSKWYEALPLKRQEANAVA